MADVGARPKTIWEGLVTIPGLAAAKIAVTLARQARPDLEETAASLDGVHAMHIKHFNGASIALAVGWVFAAFPMDADAQSRTRLVSPFGNNDSGTVHPQDSFRAALPQQAVTFRLREASDEAARASLPRGERLTGRADTIAYISQTVRVHDFYNVTLTRSQIQLAGDVEVYTYCLWADYNAAAITVTASASDILRADVLYNGRDFNHSAPSEVVLITIFFLSDGRQPGCYHGSSILGRLPQEITLYFTPTFRLYPPRITDR